jgi:hypothetical protein
MSAQLSGDCSIAVLGSTAGMPSVVAAAKGHARPQADTLLTNMQSAVTLASMVQSTMVSRSRACPAAPLKQQLDLASQNCFESPHVRPKLTCG